MKSPAGHGYSFAILIAVASLTGCDPSAERMEQLQRQIASATNIVGALELEKDKLSRMNQQMQNEIKILNEKLTRLELELQAKEHDLEGARKDIFALKETVVKRGKESERKQSEWQNLNKAYFIAKGLAKELTNPESHDRTQAFSTKWTGVYDKKQNEIEELLSVVSQFPQLKHQMKELLNDLKVLGKCYADFVYNNYKYSGGVNEVYKDSFEKATSQFLEMEKKTLGRLNQFESDLETVRNESDN